MGTDWQLEKLVEGTSPIDHKPVIGWSPIENGRLADDDVATADAWVSRDPAHRRATWVNGKDVRGDPAQLRAEAQRAAVRIAEERGRVYLAKLEAESAAERAASDAERRKGGWSNLTYSEKFAALKGVGPRTMNGLLFIGEGTVDTLMFVSDVKAGVEFIEALGEQAVKKGATELAERGTRKLGEEGTEKVAGASKYIRYGEAVEEVKIGDQIIKVGNINAAQGEKNCAACAVQLERRFRGVGADAITIETKYANVDSLESALKAYTNSKTGFKVVDPATVVRELQQGGNGARGILVGGGHRPDNVLHIFNAVNENGVVKFIDPQAGRYLSPSQFNTLDFFRTH
jgi:hypothetical protein